MEQKFITIEAILTWFKSQVEQKAPIAPSTWLDGAQKVNALFGELDEQLIKAEVAVNREQARFLEIGKSAAASKVLAKNTESYELYLTTKARREQAIEFIRIAKKRVEQPRWDQ